LRASICLMCRQTILTHFLYIPYFVTWHL
jgi:hypothetical protein